MEDRELAKSGCTQRWWSGSGSCECRGVVALVLLGDYVGRIDARRVLPARDCPRKVQLDGLSSVQTGVDRLNRPAEFNIELTRGSNSNILSYDADAMGREGKNAL